MKRGHNEAFKNCNKREWKKLEESDELISGDIF
jgi:hypothetical protein